MAAHTGAVTLVQIRVIALSLGQHRFQQLHYIVREKHRHSRRSHSTRQIASEILVLLALVGTLRLSIVLYRLETQPSHSFPNQLCLV
jgi:uncharacterized membrane protein YidH (DUF202 family)